MPRFLIALLALLTLLFSSACGLWPVDCESMEDRNSCWHAGECGWLIQSCDGAVEARCVPEEAAIVEAGCQELQTEDCHQQESWDTCDPATCRWASPGCGLEGDYPLNGATCVPLLACSPDAEDSCPGGLQCYPYTWNPCGGGGNGESCMACGVHEFTCFPPLSE